MTVGLIQGRSAQPFCLTSFDAGAHRRILTGGTAKRGVLTIERDQEDWRPSTASSRLPSCL
jgi:hypothetical protein